MAYASIDDLIARFGADQMVQLSDRTGAGVVDDAVLDQALADASAVVDGHLAGRYPVPLSPVPDILVGYTCDLARYQLYPDAQMPDDHPVRQRHRDASRFLEAVGKGALNLGAAPEPVSDNAVQVVVGERRRYGIGL